MDILNKDLKTINPRLFSNLLILQTANEDYNQEEYDPNNYERYSNKISKIEERTKIKANEDDFNKEELNKQIDFYYRNIIKNKNISLNFGNEEEIIKAKKKCGRKRMRQEDNNDNKNEHNKFSDDNIRKKIKHLVLKSLLEFINNKIKIMYKGNIGNGIFKKELQTINAFQKSNSNVNFDKDFLKKNIGEIFSEKITARFTNFPLNNNKIIIEKLKNEKDENLKIYFNKLFNINFLQCLKHFRGDSHIIELEGLKCFSQIKNDILNKYTKDGEDYIGNLEYYLKNYEEIINHKKARKRKKVIIDNINY